MKRNKNRYRFYLSCLFLFLLLGTVNLPIYADTATVKSTTLNVRSGPGLDYDVIQQIHNGSSYTILSKKDSWIEISLNDQKNGWVADWLVDVTAEPAQSVAQLHLESTVDILNVRSGPSTNYKIIDKISTGRSYPLLEASGEWSKIQLADDRSGWVATQYTKTITITSNNQTGTIDSSTSKNETQAEVTTVIVNTDILNLRKSPSLQADIVKKLSLGTEAKALQTTEEWSEVQLDDGTKGWVYRTYIKEIKGVQASQDPDRANDTSTISLPADAKVRIITNGTNIRKGPSTQDEVVRTTKAGETYPIVKIEGDWFLINIGDGKTAYIAGWVVTAEGIPNIEKSTTSTTLKGKVIVVDAGHGGSDRGAEGVSKKTKEKEVNLIVAKLVASKLEAAGAKVILTRSNDTFLSLQQRVDISTKYKADAFISIHHNSYKSSSMKGSMTFYYSSKRDKNLASFIQTNLVKHNGLKDLGIRFGDYHVIRENTQPAVLVELGFLSNNDEELLIRSSKFQENSAEGIFQGIVKYFTNN